MISPNPYQTFVTVYGPGRKKALRNISQAISRPDALALDGTGDLYVANAGCAFYPSCSPYVPSSVTVYAQGSKRVLRNITQGVNLPVALVFDGSGNLYVANEENNTVTVYAPGSRSVLRTVSQGLNGPNSLALDASGNLYVANEEATLRSMRRVAERCCGRFLKAWIHRQCSRLAAVAISTSQTLRRASPAP